MNFRTHRSVTWTSSASGSTKTKAGFVVGFIPSGYSAFAVFHNLSSVMKLPDTMCEFDDISSKDRYLVVVSHIDGKVAHRTKYYAPLCSVVNKQNG